MQFHDKPAWKFELFHDNACDRTPKAFREKTFEAFAKIHDIRKASIQNGFIDNIPKCFWILYNWFI